jgi:hypothetical protein
MGCISTVRSRRQRAKALNRLGSGHRSGYRQHRGCQRRGCRSGGDVRLARFRFPQLGRADRERILLRFADLVEQHGEELAQLETLEQGNRLTFPAPLKWAAR